MLFHVLELSLLWILGPMTVGVVDLIFYSLTSYQEGWSLSQMRSPEWETEQNAQNFPNL